MIETDEEGNEEGGWRMEDGHYNFTKLIPGSAAHSRQCRTSDNNVTYYLNATFHVWFVGALDNCGQGVFILGDLMRGS